MADRKTNTEFVTDLMEFSPFGAIAQLVIVRAIDAYTRQIAETDIDELQAMMPPLISAEAWQGACQDIQERIEKQYSNKAR